MPITPTRQTLPAVGPSPPAISTMCLKNKNKKISLSTSSLIPPSYTIRATIFEKVSRPEKFPKTEYFAPSMQLLPSFCHYCRPHKLGLASRQKEGKSCITGAKYAAKKYFPLPSKMRGVTFQSKSIFHPNLRFFFLVSIRRNFPGNTTF